MGEHIRLESVWYNAPVVGKNGSSSIDPLTASRIDEGGYATIYRVPIQPGLPVGGILKVFKRFPEPYRAGERLRRKAKWGALYDEYDMLCALDGLDGHVPQAYACGFFVIDDEAIPCDFELPAGTYLTYRYRGSYAQDADALRNLAEYRGMPGLCEDAAPFEIYEVDNRDTVREEEFLTRVELRIG